MIPDNKTLLELENIYRFKIISINNEIEETKKSSDEAYKNFLKEELDKNVKNFLACIPLHDDYEMLVPIFKSFAVNGSMTISFCIENHLEYSISENWIFLCFDFLGKRFDGGSFSLEFTIEENIKKNKKELEKEQYMAKDFLGNEIHVGDVVCYVDYTKTKSWMDIARIEKINKSGVTLKMVEGLTKALPSKFKRNLYAYKDGVYQKVGERLGKYKRFDKIVKYFPFPDSIEKENPHSIKDSEISDSIKKEKPHSIKDLEKRSRYLRIEAEDPFYEEEFIDNKETNIYAALSNENSSGIEVCIDLKTHKIVEPEKVPDGNLYIKSCDTGTYTLMDEDFFPIAEMNGYGPNKLIPPINGNGDYIDLKVKDNVIVNWYEHPSFEEFHICIK